MPVDASIYNLANQPAQFGPDLKQIITLQNLAQQMQARKMIMDQEQQGQNALRQVFSNPENINAQGLPTPNALAQIGRASPEAYMDLLPKVSAAQHNQILTQAAQGKQFTNLQQDWVDVRKQAVSAFDQASKAEGPEAGKKAYDQVWSEGLADLGKKGYPPEWIQQIPKSPIPVEQSRMRNTSWDVSQLTPAEKRAESKFTDKTDYGRSPPVEYREYPDGSMTDKLGRPYTPTGIGEPKGPEATLYGGTVSGPDGKPKPITVTRSPTGGWLDDKGQPVTGDISGIHKVGTKGEGGAAGGAGLKDAKEVTIVNDKGDPVESAAVLDDPGSPSGLKHLGTNEPVVIPPGGRIQEGKIAGVATGRQLAQQNLTIIGSGAQVSAALHNLTNLPFSGNIGWLKGIGAQAPEGITDAIRKSLAGEVTSRDARAFQLSWQGVSRALSQLETFGARTGLVGLTKQAETLMPQPGDTTTNVLRSYAELRQIVEQALQTTRSSPGITPQMQGQIDDILGRTRKAVPFTVEDVQNLEDAKTSTRGQRDEKIRQFADRMFKTRVTASSDPEEANKQWAEAKPGTVFVDQHGNEYTK